MDIVSLLFKWLPLMIRFIIFGKKVVIFLIRKYLNVMRFYHGKFVKLHVLKLILWYYLVHIDSILCLYRFWWSDGFHIINQPIIFP